MRFVQLVRFAPLRGANLRPPRALRRERPRTVTELQKQTDGLHRLFAFGASDGTRTRDLVLTKDALYLLSYTSLFDFCAPSETAFLLYVLFLLMSIVFALIRFTNLT